MVASGSVGAAWAMVLGAGAASSLGACVVFCVRVATPRVVASSLGFAAGVMLYVVFTELLMVESRGLFAEAGYSAAAYRLATGCFFGGIALTALLDACLHRMMHWAAGRRRSVAGGRYAAPCCSPSFASPASSECGDHSPSDLECGDRGDHGAAEPQLLSCASCTDIDAACEKDQGSSTGGGREQELELGCMPGASMGAPGAPYVRPTSPPRLSLRRQPCCAGSPDCYEMGGGRAAAEVVLSAEAAQVVTLLESDPHTKDLLRMGIFTGIAIVLHNIPEGLATFVGALSDAKVGASIAVAIAIHNIPEGICVAMPIYYSTGSKWQGFLWGSLTGFAEPLGGLIGYLAVHERDPLSFAIVFGLISGMMVYVSVKELLPSAFRFDPKDTLASASVLVGMGVMAASLLLFTL